MWNIRGAGLCVTFHVEHRVKPSCRSQLRLFHVEHDPFDVRFDQENLQTRPYDFQCQSRKTASGTHVGEPTLFQGYGFSGVHTLAKMPVKYLQRVANRCKVNLFIPGQQNLYILLNLKHLIVISRELEFGQSTAYYGD